MAKELVVEFTGYKTIELPERLEHAEIEEIWADDEVQDMLTEIDCGELENIDSEPHILV